MEFLKASNDVLISMSRKILENSDILKVYKQVSFSITTDDEGLRSVNVYSHKHIKNSCELVGNISMVELVTSYLGLSLPTDLEANDAVTRGHRLGNRGI